MKGVTLDEDALVMAERDDVATALADLPRGRTFAYDDRSVTLRDDIPFGHKFALDPIDAGARVRKYGEVIGAATTDIDAGEWVHTHNLESLRGRPAATETDAGATPPVEDGEPQRDRESDGVRAREGDHEGAEDSADTHGEEGN